MAPPRPANRQRPAAIPLYKRKPVAEMTEAEAREAYIAIMQDELAFRRVNYIRTVYLDKGPLRRQLYPKHMAFFEAGATHMQRAAIGSNRSGKSFLCSYETTCHLTGYYPAWWKGRKFDRPITAWVAGEDSKSIRESLQPMFMGKPGEYGTGLIPVAHIAQVINASGTSEMVDTVTVKHVKGGLSRLTFKAYTQERESFQAARVDVMQFDEEPPISIYTEGLTRTMSVVPGQPNGLVICGFTPLKGLSGVVLSFVPGGKPVEGASEDGARWATFIAWEDVPHLDKDAQLALRATYLPHELKARTQGIPALGAGAIYPIDESEIVCDPFEFPAWYKHAYGMDVGWNRTAAIWGALDPETDVLYLYSEHYRGQAEPEIHASAIRSRGSWIPGAIDPAARGRAQGDGQKLLEIYQGLGLVLVEADNAVEAGLYAVWSRLSTGKLKVFRTLQNFLMEYRIYRRDESGKIVKNMDHLCDCLRYLCLSGIGMGAQKPADMWKGLPGNPKPRNIESDYNPFAAAWAAGRAGAAQAPRGRSADGWMPGRPLR